MCCGVLYSAVECCVVLCCVCDIVHDGGASGIDVVIWW